MAENLDVGDFSSPLSALSSRAFSEKDLAQGVSKWMVTNFSQPLEEAVRGTPFTIPLLCAIACREAGAYWLPLTPHKSPAEILGLCVYDASGDVSGAPRGVFPVNTAEFRLAYGSEFTEMLVEEANKARAARGLAPASIVYKGYGIFQYDLQYVRSDESFFRAKKWQSFSECVARAVGELKKKYAVTHDIRQAVRAYNGSGPSAEQYARDVMRLLPYCEEVTPGHSADAGAHLRDAALRGLAAAPDDDDPAAPHEGEISETADHDSARVLTNLGATGFLDEAAPGVRAEAAARLMPLDLAKAHAFLKACMTSHPRVTYGLGAKVPFLGAVPGKDFTKVDCSGFIRELVRLSTSPAAKFPDGSVVQHDWVRAQGFEKSTVDAAKNDDGLVRIAFLRPQDSAERIGHVLLIDAAKTLESHGGVGPDSRDWTGAGFQAKTLVYIFARK